jgi:hypothetical protein
LFPRLPERISDLHREAHRQNNLLRRVEELRLHGHYFFLRRAPCTAYGRSPQMTQRSPSRRRCRRRGLRVLDPRYGSLPTRSGSCGVRVTDRPIGNPCCERFATA